MLDNKGCTRLFVDGCASKTHDERVDNPCMAPSHDSRDVFLMLLTNRPWQMNMINIAFKVLIESSLGYASVGEEHQPLREVGVRALHMSK